MRALLLTLLLISNLANAATSFNLENVKLHELAKIVFVDLLKTNYIANQDFQTSEKILSINLTDKTDKQVLTIIKQVLKQNDFELHDLGSHYYISPVSQNKANQVPFFYKPKHRPVNYITDLMTGIFETGRFTFQARPVATNNEIKTNNQINDTGTTAYSQLQKPKDSFIFLGSRAEVELLESLLTQIDTPTSEVLVKAYLYEVSNTKSDSSSFNLALNILNNKLGLAAVTPVLANTISLKIPNFEAVYSAFATDTRFKVLSNPQLRVKDGANANFTVGSETPILGAVITSNGQSTQSVEYKSSGTILDITPTIRKDVIELQVKQQLSNFIKTTTGVNNSPTLIKRELSSTILTKDGELVIIGGLNESKETSEKTGLPFLPDFLKAKASDSNNSDILLILHVTKI